MSYADKLRLPFFAHALHQNRDIALRKLSDHFDMLKHLDSSSINFLSFCFETASLVGKFD
jgi:hypothetical protein